MAASDFETNKMEKLYPGLNVQPGVVDKSGAIDDSLLTTLAGSAMLGMENYQAIETKKGLQTGPAPRPRAASSSSGRPWCPRCDCSPADERGGATESVQMRCRGVTIVGVWAR